MNRRTTLSAVLTAVMALACGLPANANEAPTDAQIRTRSEALEVAGAFSNDEFILRDGHLWGTLSPDKATVVQVNLYAGNQYWFVAAASPEAERLSVSLYGEDGKPVTYEPYQDGARAAAGFSPSVSGPYYVRITGTKAADFCLLYSYK